MTDKRTSEKTEEELNRDYEIYIQSKTVNGRYCPTPDLYCYPESEDELSYYCEELCYIEQNFYESDDVYSEYDTEIEGYYTNFMSSLSSIPSPTSVITVLGE